MSKLISTDQIAINTFRFFRGLTSKYSSKDILISVYDSYISFIITGISPLRIPIMELAAMENAEDLAKNWCELNGK